MEGRNYIARFICIYYWKVINTHKANNITNAYICIVRTAILRLYSPPKVWGSEYGRISPDNFTLVKCWRCSGFLSSVYPTTTVKMSLVCSPLYIKHWLIKPLQQDHIRANGASRTCFYLERQALRILKYKRPHMHAHNILSFYSIEHSSHKGGCTRATILLNLLWFRRQNFNFPKLNQIQFCKGEIELCKQCENQIQGYKMHFLSTVYVRKAYIYIHIL